MLESSRKAIRQHFAPTLTPSGFIDAERTAYKIAAWSQEFFGDPTLSETGHYHIRDAIPEFHVKLYMDLMSPYRLYYITCPSEFGKTTCCTLIAPLYHIIYLGEPYTVLSSRVDDTTVGLLDLMKEEITDNQKFISVYGDLKPPNVRNGNFMWSDHHIVLITGQKVSAIPVGGNIRSRRKGQWRVTLFIGDDFEEVADLRSNAVLVRNKDWLKRTVEKRLDRDFGKLRLIGTNLGPGCTINNVRKDTRWKGRIYKAVNKDSNGVEYSLWESRWPIKYLQKERHDAIKNGEYDDWLYERQNEDSALSKRRIRGYKFHNLRYVRTNFQNYLVNPEDPQEPPIPVNMCFTTDPAYGSNNKKNDERAILVFAFGTKLVYNEYVNAPVPLICIWVLEVIKNFMDPSFIIESIMDFHKKYYLQYVTLETISAAILYESFLQKRLLSDEFFTKNPFTPNYVRTQPANKAERVYDGIQPKAKYGQLFVRPDHFNLIKEMEEFDPDNIHLLDALDTGIRYSTPHKSHVIDGGRVKNVKNINQRNFRGRTKRNIGRQSNMQLALNAIPSMGSLLNLHKVAAGRHER